MCEFNVILNGKVEFKDVVYVKVDGDNVTVKNILGEGKEFKNCKIVEVDVPNTRLVLSRDIKRIFFRLFRFFAPF